MRKPSAVVDTNLFISALILPKGNPSRLIALWKKDMFTLVSSGAMMEELEIVLARPKYEKMYAVSSSRKKRLIQRIHNRAHVLSSLTRPPVHIRDAKDIIVLATALDAHADYLVTGDNDILALKKKHFSHKLRIVTVVEFIEEFYQ